MSLDWWFGTFFIFPYIGNNHPNGLIFFRGVQTTNQLEYYDIYDQSSGLKGKSAPETRDFPMKSIGVSCILSQSIGFNIWNFMESNGIQLV